MKQMCFSHLASLCLCDGYKPHESYRSVLSFTQNWVCTMDIDELKKKKLEKETGKPVAVVRPLSYV